MAGNGSAFTSGNANAPQGSQVAFVQETGSISQAVNFAAAGSYVIGVSAAQRANFGSGDEEVEVLVDGAAVETFEPQGTGYTTFTTPALSLTAGMNTISFVGIDPGGTDSTAFLDQVTISSAPASGSSGAGAVNISSAFNRTGIVADGTIFGGGGLDDDGFAPLGPPRGFDRDGRRRHLQPRPRRRPRRRQRRRPDHRSPPPAAAGRSTCSQPRSTATRRSRPSS